MVHRDVSRSRYPSPIERLFSAYDERNSNGFFEGTRFPELAMGTVHVAVIAKEHNVGILEKSQFS